MTLEGNFIPELLRHQDQPKVLQTLTAKRVVHLDKQRGSYLVTLYGNKCYNEQFLYKRRELTFQALQHLQRNDYRSSCGLEGQ